MSQTDQGGIRGQIADASSTKTGFGFNFVAMLGRPLDLGAHSEGISDVIGWHSGTLVCTEDDAYLIQSFNVKGTNLIQMDSLNSNEGKFYKELNRFTEVALSGWSALSPSGQDINNFVSSYNAGQHSYYNWPSLGAVPNFCNDVSHMVWNYMGLSTGAGPDPKYNGW